MEKTNVLKVFDLPTGLSWYAAESTENDWRLVALIQQGIGELQLNGVPVRLQPARLLRWSSGDHITLVNFTGAGRLFAFNSTLLREQAWSGPLLSLFSWQPGRASVDITKAKQTSIAALYRLIAYEIRQEPEPPIIGTYGRLVLEHIDSAFGSIRLRRLLPREQQLVKRLLERMQSDFRQQPATYAADLELPVRELNRIAKAATGRIVLELQRERVLTEAERLLLQTDMRIKEIAYELDFTDQTHFAKFFRRYHHCSPGDFRAGK